MGRKPVPRRTVLGSIGFLGVATIGLPAGSAVDGPDSGRSDGRLQGRRNDGCFPDRTSGERPPDRGGDERPPDVPSDGQSGGRRSGLCDRPPLSPAVANHPDVYVATVDRVVDGAHVVILLEAGGRVVDQVVVPADEYPCLEERDELVVRLDGREPTWMRRRREDGGRRPVGG